MTDYRRWIKQVISWAEKTGWKVEINGHIKFRSPEGKMVVCSATPRNPHTIHNVRRDFRRIGYEIV